MLAILFGIGCLIAAHLGWSSAIVRCGSHYQAFVRQAVMSEIGESATPYLNSGAIVEQITDAFCRGDPASLTALGLILLIRETEED